MNFGEALHDLKNGFRLTRDAWATALFVVLQRGYPEGIAINANTASATGLPEGTVCVFRPYLMVQHVDGSFSPWVPSVGDVLAEDWHIVHGQESELSTPHGEHLAGGRAEPTDEEREAAARHAFSGAHPRGLPPASA